MRHLPFVVLLLTAVVLGPLAPTSARGSRTATRFEDSKTQVVILGSGNPVPTPEASGPSVAVVVNGAAYVVDSGPGVVRRASAAVRNGIDALAAPNLKIAFITHLHSDHTLGLPDLIFTPWVMGRTAPLEVYGPRGLQRMTEHIESAWEKDVAIRSREGGLAPPTGYEVRAHEVEPGIIFKDQNVTVTAFLVAHGTWDQAFGYRFQTADRTVVISGDTGPTDAIARACAGCDVLLHEVYSETLWRTRPPARQTYLRAFHTSTLELAREASEAKPGLLILYHQGYGAVPQTQADHDQMARGLVDEVQQRYSGKVVSARDLDVY